MILRYANVYGRRQRPGPYSGVCVTLHSRLIAGDPVIIHEDGRQTRDFVSVDDVVRATTLAGTVELSGVQTVNVGTGRATTVLDLVPILKRITSRDTPTVMEGTFRPGDIRHLWVDNAAAKRQLGFTATTDLEKGLLAAFQDAA